MIVRFFLCKGWILCGLIFSVFHRGLFADQVSVDKVEKQIIIDENTSLFCRTMGQGSPIIILQDTRVAGKVLFQE